MNLRLVLTGTKPLMMHSIDAANPLNPDTARLRAAVAKRKKSEEDLREIFQLEFLASIYHDPELGPVVPAHNVISCLVDAAKLVKRGRDITRSVQIEEEFTPLEYKGPRDLGGLLEAGDEFVDVRAVRVMSSRTMRSRPIFREWKLQPIVQLDTKVMDVEDFASIVVSAGRMVGLGDFRQRYGRFSALVEQA